MNFYKKKRLINNTSNERILRSWPRRCTLFCQKIAVCPPVCTADVGMPSPFRMASKHRNTNGRKYECRYRTWRSDKDLGFIIRLLVFSLFRLLILSAAADWQGTVKFCDTSLGYVRHKKGYTVWRGESDSLAEETSGLQTACRQDSLRADRVLPSFANYCERFLLGYRVLPHLTWDFS